MTQSLSHISYFNKLLTLLTLPKHLGHQYIIELYGCNPAVLNDIAQLEGIMHTTALECGATIIKQHFHQFTPQGVSGTIIIAESHLNIHTWPEYGYAAVDIFTCGDSLRPLAGKVYLEKSLYAQRSTFQKILRGTGLDPR